MRAAGIMFVAPGGRVLLVRRTGAGDAEGLWAFPGGKIEGDESAEAAARREAQEETGWADPKTSLREWTRRNADGVDFTTFRADLKDVFEPTLNEEHDAHRWVDRAELAAPRADDAKSATADDPSRGALVDAVDERRPIVEISPDGTVRVFSREAA